MNDIDKKIEAANVQEEGLGVIQDIVHQEIWETLPEEQKGTGVFFRLGAGGGLR